MSSDVTFSSHQIFQFMNESVPSLSILVWEEVETSGRGEYGLMYRYTYLWPLVYVHLRFILFLNKNFSSVDVIE